MSEPLENVLNHLMFHKAIIGEDNGHEKLDRYLDLARTAALGEQYAPKDPLDRSLGLVFELVLQQNYDPWDVDLVSFTDMYMKRMKQSEVNFIVAGKLVFMAWSILKMQSEEVLSRSDDKRELFCSDWDFDCLEEFYDHDQRCSVVSDIPECVDLTEAVRHQAERPVSLMELLDALEEAREDARRQEERALARERMKLDPSKFDAKNHAEDLEKDVEMVWNRILKCGPGPVSIEDLCQGGVEDKVTVFVSLLFLARNSKISLWQDQMPFGQVFLEIKIPWDIATLEDAKVAAPVPPQKLAVM